MTPENTKKLFDAFPGLYRGCLKRQQAGTPMSAFVFGDGWFDLIWTVSQTLESLAVNAGLDPHGEAWPEAAQVGQKYGLLCFGLKNTSDDMTTIIEYAQMASARTCELCGKTASRVTDSGAPALCTDHVLKVVPEAAANNKT